MDTKKSPVQAGIYARISADLTQEGLGVARQIQDCSELAQGKGWEVSGVYPENDTSATRSKSRPEYERLTRDVKAGRIQAIAIWDVDRLTRTPRELEDLIDLADQYGLALGSVGGDIDLSQPQGRMTARIKGTVARHETDQMSRRVRRKLVDNASKGNPHAPAAYGYERKFEFNAAGKKIRSWDVVNPEERAILADAADKVLDGQSLRSVVTDLNRRGVPSPRVAKDGSRRWQSTSLRGMLIRERNAGLRIHQGQIIGDAQWEPLWDRATHDRLVALLTAPERTTYTYRGKTLKYLLSNIARCGRCGGVMTVTVAHKTSKVPGYTCREKRDVRRGLAEVDRVVEAYMIELLRRPGVLDKFVLGDPAEVQAATAKRDAEKAKMDLAAIEYGHDRLSLENLATINAICRPRMAEAQAIIDAHQPANLPTHIAGPDAKRLWLEEANLEQKRALIKAMVTVTIQPSGGGRRPFNPDLIEIVEV